VNFLALAQRLHRESLRSGAGPVAISGSTKEVLRLFDWINDAWYDLQVEARDWKWMRRECDAALVIGQHAYTAASLGLTGLRKWMPPSRTRTARVYPTASASNVTEMVYWPDYDEFIRRQIDVPASNGAPQMWTISPTEEILIAPAPDAAYKLKAAYTSTPYRMVIETDAPDMPEDFHLLLVWRALMELASTDAASEVYVRAKANHDAIRSALILDQGPRWAMRGRVIA